MSSDPEKPYQLEEGENNYVVVDEKQRVVCTTADKMTAGHYVSLLNEAHQRGYKKGYQQGKNA